MPVRARAIALYLPQFHPIPENDAWWGAGFTEWTNVRNARPLFDGHVQPRVPAELGYYDLREASAREAQAGLARRYGIEAFCYYHYWFAGRRILEAPLESVLASGAPDFPFCVCWANQTWAGSWYGAPHGMLIEQRYPGADDHCRHFEALLPAFRDPRYVRVNGMPVFMIFRPTELPHARETLALWRNLALQAGLPGLYIICQHRDPRFDPHRLGFDASVIVNVKPRLRWRRPLSWLVKKLQCKLTGRPRVYAYNRVVREAIAPPVRGIRSFPCVLPNWDNTPRAHVDGVVLQDSHPEAFRMHFRAAVERVSDEPADERFVFIKSWNEWGEGNYLEPDANWGDAYLRIVGEELAALRQDDVNVVEGLA